MENGRVHVDSVEGMLTECNQVVQTLCKDHSTVISLDAPLDEDDADNNATCNDSDDIFAEIHNYLDCIGRGCSHLEVGSTTEQSNDDSVLDDLELLEEMLEEFDDLQKIFAPRHSPCNRKLCSHACNNRM